MFKFEIITLYLKCGKRETKRNLGKVTITSPFKIYQQNNAWYLIKFITRHLRLIINGCPSVCLSVRKTDDNSRTL